MKKIVFILSALFSFSNLNAQNFGSFASAVFISQNNVENGFNTTGSGANLIGKPENPFRGDLGTYQRYSANLMLNGAEVKTYKNTGANVCGAIFYYSIHLIGSTSGFVSFDLPYKAGCVGNVFTDNLGPCQGNDQKWSIENYHIDLTTYIPGTYAMDVYYEIPGTSTSDVGCDETSAIGNNLSFAGTMTFTIVSEPLPIELISFTGKTADNTNIIHWDMGNEMSVSSYQLEKSTDGRHFKSITIIAADRLSKGHYSFVDALSSNEQNLYRLKLVDKNNSSIYSNVITLNDKINEASVIAIPNPAKDFVNITSTMAESAVISLFNISGKNLKSFTTLSNKTKIDLSGLSSGVYIISYKNAHTSQMIRITKQ